MLTWESNQNWLEDSKRAGDLENALSLLAAHSLSNQSERDSRHSLWVSLHPLVSEWTRLRLHEAERKQFLVRATKLIDFHLRCDHEQMMSFNFEVKRWLLAHLNALMLN